MKMPIKIAVKTGLLALALVAFAGVASAQNAKLNLENLSRLESSAVEIVDVSLDENLVKLGKGFILNKHSGVEKAEALEAIAGIREIYVRVYRFEQEGAYTPQDVQDIRLQLQAPGWSRFANVRSKKKGDNAEVYVMMQGDRVLGLAILAANPKEIAVVNIVGDIDVQKLSLLDGDLFEDLDFDPKP